MVYWLLVLGALCGVATWAYKHGRKDELEAFKPFIADAVKTAYGRGWLDGMDHVVNKAQRQQALITEKHRENLERCFELEVE